MRRQELVGGMGDDRLVARNRRPRTRTPIVRRAYRSLRALLGGDLQDEKWQNEAARTFIDNGLPATFLDDFREEAAAVSESVVDRNKQQGRRTGATAGLVAEERRGRAILRVLNALILARIGTMCTRSRSGRPRDS